jgi:hypothetical protein
MTDSPKCQTCGIAVTLETGITLVMDDADLREYYCDEHNPNKGRGYTLADMEKWREESQVQRGEYEMSMMNLVGPDVYFAVKDKGSPMKRLLKMQREMNNTIAKLIDPGRNEAPPSSGS